MIVTQGGRFGGYGFYVLKGKPVFLYNFLDLNRVRWEGPNTLSSGKHTLEFDFKYDAWEWARSPSRTRAVSVAEAQACSRSTAGR